MSVIGRNMDSFWFLNKCSCCHHRHLHILVLEHAVVAVCLPMRTMRELDIWPMDIMSVRKIETILMIKMTAMMAMKNMLMARQLRRARRKLRQLTLTGLFHRHRHNCHHHRHRHNCHRHHRDRCHPRPKCTDMEGPMTQEWGKAERRLQRVQEIAAWTLLGISSPN